MEQLVIYRNGDTHIQDTIVNWFASYSKRLYGEPLTPAAYAERFGKEYECIPFDTALERIRQAEETNYIHPWKEITEEIFLSAMECLPPEKWQWIDGVEIFRMCEYQISNITAHYCHYKHRFFVASRRTTTDYREIAREIKEAVCQNQP